MKISKLLLSLAMLLVLSAGALGAFTTGSGVPSARAVSAKRALFVVSNISDIPSPGGGQRASGVWLSEVTDPYWALHDAAAPQFTIDLASPNGGPSAIDGFSVKLSIDDWRRTGVTDSGNPSNERFLSDPETRDLVQIDAVPQADGTVQQRYSFRDTLPLASVNAADYDVVFFVGGNAAIFQFVNDEHVYGAASAAYDAGKLVSAVCHGTSALLEARLPDGRYLVAGRRVTGFSNAEEDMLGQRAVTPVLLENEFPLRGATYTAAAPFTEHVAVDGRLITGQQPASGHAVGEAIVAYFAKSAGAAVAAA
ncbi:MAG: type 1 glutamine amidotransferase domain-containing protein [Mycobacterium sp.]|uniref:type 1 glutamine amidotransferase domain-containing protein n=1 Tax=Mycobacterium sp. TaxID=1785 RepID=UPI003F9AE8A5